MKRIFILAVFYIFNVTSVKAGLPDSTCTFNASYTGDGVANFSGGIKKGVSYLGFATIGVEFDFERAKLWKGGSFYIKGGNTHGGTPTETLIGDYQTVSNIEAGDHTFIQEMWYKQVFNAVEITLGIQDLNANFVVCDYACNFINSSFGVQSTFSTNIDIPIFPLTALGVSLKWNISNKFSWMVSGFDGYIDNWETNPYNVRWSLDDKNFLFVNEFVWEHPFFHEQEGNIKLGGYYHSGAKNYGLYASANQIVWSQNEKKIESFAQFSISSPKLNNNYLYVGFGCNLIGFFSSKHDDVLGLGIAHAHFKEAIEHETAIELTYKRHFFRSFFIQPDLQYIINPAGTDEPLKNALVGILRFGFEF